MAARKQTSGAKTAKGARDGVKSSAKTPRKSVTAVWEESYQPFVEVVRDRFAFLIRDHGYSEPTVAVVPPSATITFTKGEDFLRVASEYGGVPWVTVKAGDGEPFGLHVILGVLDPAAMNAAPVAAGSILTGDELRATVDYLATLVERHARDVLSGDPALLARYRARSAALRG